MEREIVKVNRFPFSVEYADIIVVKELFAVVMFERVEDEEYTSWGNTQQNSTVTSIYVVFNKESTKQLYEKIYTDNISQPDLSSDKEMWKEIWFYVIKGEGCCTGWRDWVSSEGVHGFTLDEVEDTISITFYREERYGNWEYGNGYKKYQYTIDIKKECLDDNFSGNSMDYISITEEITEHQQMY